MPQGMLGLKLPLYCKSQTPGNMAMATPHLFLEEFQTLGYQKPLITENYAILNKRQVATAWITTLATL